MSDDTTRQGYSIFAETMADMTYPEIERAAADGAVALWGLGVIEEHGPHLPLATDVYVPMAILRGARRLLRDQGIPSVIVPAFYWGVNHVTAHFPGSFEVRPAIMIEMMLDIFRSLRKDGFRDVFCLSGHGDLRHNQAIYDAVMRCRSEVGIASYKIMSRALADRMGCPPGDPLVAIEEEESHGTDDYLDIHAGSWETSVIWATCPELVRQEIAATLPPTNFSTADFVEWRTGPAEAKRKTPHGYLGNPADADPARGARVIEARARAVAAAIATTRR